MRRAVLLTLLVAACSESSDSGPDAGPVDAAINAAADRCSTTEPCALALGTAETEFIYPVGDSDAYEFDVASAGQVITVVVMNDADLSPVVLEVVLFGPDETSIVNRRGEEGFQRIEIQLVAATAGRHRVVVRDVANDDEDEFNPYQVTVDLLSQTDENEPNDTATNPTVLSPGVRTSGTIGEQGDEDWFRITVAQNQLVQIAMSAVGESPVRLNWTLYEATGTTPLASSTEPSSGSWPVELRAVGNAAGDYLIAVRDDDGQQADLQRVYALTVDLLTEPDIQDLAAPNETVETATPLTSGQTINGFIATTSDLDYYAIQVTGASMNNPRLITVEAEMAGLSPVDLSFVVFDRDGQTEVCDTRDGDLCKALRFNVDGAARRSVLKTAHPVFVDGTYYVLVRDLQDNDFDENTGYTLTVSVVNEPDTNENFRLSGRAGSVVVPTTTPTTTPTIQFAWVEGYISHANDQDWYQFDIPGPVGAAPGHNGDYLVQLELQIIAPTPVELEAFFFGPENSERRSYGGYGQRCRRPDNPEDPEPCQWPDAENGIEAAGGGPLTFGETNGDCFVVFREVTEDGPHYFRMTDLDRDDFDLGTRYRFRVTLTADCPANSVCMGEFVQNGVDFCVDR